MLSFVFFLSFLLLYLTYRKGASKSVGAYLLLFYTISALFTWLEYYAGPINAPALTPLSTLYYISSVFISLFPFLILGKYDCRHFQMSERLFFYLSVVLIVVGFVDLVALSIKIINNRAFLLSNIADVRNAFYDNFLYSEPVGPFDKIRIIVREMMYMAPFCSIYFLAKGNKNLSVLLAIVSLSLPLRGISIGEREAIVKYLANWGFVYLFFRPILGEKIKKSLKRIGLIFFSPLILFVIAMTFARFGEDEGGVLRSLFLYAGDQPYFFTTIFSDSGIAAQAQGGRLCFRYFFPVPERVQGQINFFIDSDIYLNQFGGLPASFYFDFGYLAIVVIFIISLIYFLIIKHSKKVSGKYPLHITALFVFSFQVLFMNIFYYDYGPLFSVLFSVFFIIVSWIYPKLQSVLSK
jgi:hypothetical protein